MELSTTEIAVVMGFAVISLIIAHSIWIIQNQDNKCKECGVPLYEWDAKRAECKNIECSNYGKRV